MDEGGGATLPSAAQIYFPTLDGWRAVAILLVIASHAHGVFVPLEGEDRAVGFGWLLLSWGRLGVDVFFAISGFLICTRLLLEWKRRGEISLGSFYIRRAFRILPPYLAYLGVYLALGMSGSVVFSGREIAGCLAFARNYQAMLPGSATAHFWSLAVEEHFYVLWPSMLVVLGASRAWRAALGLALGVAVWRGVDAHWVHLPNLLWRTDARLDALLWPCAVAILLPLARGIEATALRHAPLLGAAVLILLVSLKAPLLPTWLALLFPVMVVGTVVHPGTIEARALEWPPARWVGRLSYSLYIWQGLFLQARTPAGTRFLATLLPSPWLLFALTFVCAAASYYGIERPMIRVGQRISRRAYPGV